MKIFAIALILLVTVGTGRASKEGILPLSSFHLESMGIGASGKIVVEGTQDGQGQITELKIGAFGKEFVVPRQKLARLVTLPANGIRISYEAGYKELGGRTIYIQFQMGFTSSTKKQALVTLAEDGRITVDEFQLPGA
jgi:hypothetical protein